MKNSTKAALMNALLCPGLGHLAIGRARRGLLFLAPLLLAVAFLLRAVIALADALLAEIQAGTLALDPFQLIERIHASGIDNPQTNGAALVIILCWVGSVADALWLGRRASR